MLCELSLICDSLSFGSAEPEAKGRGTIPLEGLAFAEMPFAELPFTTSGGFFSEVEILEVFAKQRVGFEIAVGEEHETPSLP